MTESVIGDLNEEAILAAMRDLWRFPSTEEEREARAAAIITRIRTNVQRQREIDALHVAEDEREAAEYRHE